MLPEAISIGLTDTMDFAARQVLLFYYTHLSHHEENLRGGWDVEALHDMRVATRRLRVACRLFRTTLRPKTLEPFNEHLRYLGELLGAVRDLDVFIEFVDGYAQAHGASAGLDALRSRLEGEREAPRAALAWHLGRERYHRFKQDFEAWLHGESSWSDRPKKAGTRLVQHAVPVLLARAREEIRTFGPRIASQPGSETLHALRIACKRLRYTAEFFKSCYGKRLSPLISRATEFQDILGRHHDADVHIAYLTGCMSRLDRRSSRQRGIQADLETVVASERQEQEICRSAFEQRWNETDHPFFIANFSLTLLSGDI
jgi:CHAD domain-containing protein